MEKPQRFGFEGFALDRSRRALMDPEGAPVALPAKAFEGLVYFLEHPGEVIERRRLIDALWPDAVVEENNLSQAIAAIRRALGDGLIVTIPRQGYQFVGNVTVLDPVPQNGEPEREPGDSARAAQTAAPRRWSRRKLGYAAAAALALFAFVFALDLAETENEPQSRLPLVAVLPCDDLSPNPNDAYFAAGIHEEILNQLGKIGSLLVVARTPMMAYADPETRPPIRDIADDLDATALMECSVRYAADRVVVTAQLIDPRSSTRMFSETYSSDLNDVDAVFAMQADIARRIARGVGAEITPAEQQQLEELPTDSLEAYAEYLKAYAASDNNDPFVVAGMPHIERAIEIDPEFALAYAVRGRIHVVRAWHSAEWPGSPYEPEHELTLAREDALRALAIDDDLGAGHGVLGAVESAAGSDLEARARFERALALSPHDNVIMYWYTAYLLSHGERLAALELTERMHEQNSDTVTELMLLAGDIEGAAEAFTAPIDPEASSFPVHALAGTGHLLLGRNEAAEREFRVAEALLPPVSAPGSRPMNPWRINRFLPMLVYGFGRLGLHDEAERVFRVFEAAIEDSEGPRAITTIYAYLGVGDVEEAYRMAEQFVADPTPSWATGRLSFVLNPVNDPVLDRPEFVELRRELGFQD